MKHILIVILALAVATLACGGPSPNPDPLPTSNPIFSANGMIDCTDQLVLSLRRLEIHHLNMEAITPTNELKALIFLSDGNALSQFNYNVMPLSVMVGTQVDFGRFHTAIDLAGASELYAWIAIVDDQSFSEFGEITAEFLNSIASFLVGAVGSTVNPGVGFAASLGADIAGSQLTNWLQQDEIIGDIAFSMNETNGWLQGVHFPTTPNGAVDLAFSIQAYDCQTTVIDFPPLDEAGSIPPTQPTPVDQSRLVQCVSNAPRTNLQVGDMAIVSVPNNIFFRNAPDIDAPGIRYARGHLVRIAEGAVCDGDIMYWRVLDWEGRSGWMAESRIDPATGQGVYLLSVVNATT